MRRRPRPILRLQQLLQLLQFHQPRPLSLRRRSPRQSRPDRKSTRLNSSHTEIYTLSLHDALPISTAAADPTTATVAPTATVSSTTSAVASTAQSAPVEARSEEHTSELQSHRDLHSFPTRRSSDLDGRGRSYDCNSCSNCYSFINHVRCRFDGAVRASRG